jgi:hypothetical protein
MRSTYRPSTRPRPQLESELDEELGCGREVVNYNADVVHPLDRHVLDGKESTFEPREVEAELRSAGLAQAFYH